MRLLNVHRYSFRKGGAEAVFLDHKALFQQEGWSCADFVMDHPRNEPSEWSRYYPKHFDASQKGSSVSGAVRFIYSFEAKRKMAQMLEAFRPDIVHVHGLYQQLTPSVLSPIAERHIPVVYTAHDLKLLCPAYLCYSERTGVCERCAGGNTISCFTKRCIRNSSAASLVYAVDGAIHRAFGSYERAISAYVMPSRFFFSKFEEYGFPREKLHYIPNSFETTINTPADEAKRRAIQSEYGSYILYFGRLSPEKGLRYLIEACARARLSLVLVGEGPLESELRQLAEQLHATVAFVGHQTGKSLWAYVEAARCVVLPSIWYENAPKSILEAQARGKVTVVSQVGGLPELVEDGVTGFLVPPGDVAVLSSTLLKVSVLADSVLSQIGEAAKMRLTTTFTQNRYYAEMSALYAQLLQGKPPMERGRIEVNE